MLTLENVYDIMKKMNISEIEKYIKENNNEDIYHEMILFVAYDLYGYEFDDDKMSEKLKRSKQHIFKKRLLEKYKKCIITGEEDEAVLEACHITQYSKCDDLDKYDINNGLLMTANMHSSFDKYHFTIDQYGTIIKSNKTKVKELQNMNNKKINIKLNSAIKKHLKIHNNEFFKRNDI